jgi:subfamily B ATP-binding cassette protein MsbA
VSGIGTLLMEALAGLERMRGVLREPREEDDPARTAALGPIRGEVVLDHVGFAYVPGHPVLHDVCVRAAPGTVTAICGPSGAGKSTLVGLVASFYRPTEGRVLVDGVDLATVRLASYRAQIGVVLQETFLFDGTILENIAFARPSASREEILAAARSAHVDAFVSDLPDGYDTRVGERGVRLSGGQRQRLSIARALLADPRILILDEATSSLDSASEALVQEALARLLVGRTTFVIAHRLSTIRRADRILVVDDGRVVEEGTHAALTRRGGRYAAMLRAQDHSRSTPT